MKPLPVPFWHIIVASPQQWPQHLLSVITTLLLLVISSLFFAMIRSWRWRKSSISPNNGRLQLPPGPPRLPHQMGALPHQSLRELARRHGPVMLLRLGMVPTVVVSSAEAAREVMKTHDADCCSRPDTPGPRRLSYGHKDVSFAPYGSHWREMHKILAVELLSMRRVKDTWYAREAEVFSQ